MKRGTEEDQVETRKKVTELQKDLLELREAHAKLRTSCEKLRRDKERVERERDESRRSVQDQRRADNEEERRVNFLLGQVLDAEFHSQFGRDIRRRWRCLVANRCRPWPTCVRWSSASRCAHPTSPSPIRNEASSTHWEGSFLQVNNPWIQWIPRFFLFLLTQPNLTQPYPM